MTIDLTKMNETAAGFLRDFAVLANELSSLDIAALIRHEGEKRWLLAARFTLGTPPQDCTEPETEHECIDEWELVRTRVGGTCFGRVLAALDCGDAIKIPDQPVVWSTRNDARECGRNSIVSSSGGIFGERARCAWLGLAFGRMFESHAEYDRFLYAVKRSHRFHDIADLSGQAGFRGSFGPDDRCYARFEIEIPLYRDPVTWKEDAAILKFDIRAPFSAKDVVVKWRSGDARGKADLLGSGSEYLATLTPPKDSFDATVLAGSLVVEEFIDTRPTVPVALAEYFPEIDSPVGTVEEDAVDYELYGTKRMTLFKKAKKEVGPGRPYEIVKRDIHDAMWCLSKGRFKLAAILAGGIVEAVLKVRLATETKADLDAAYLKAFSTAKKAKALDDLNLYELIRVARERKRLEAPGLYDNIRDWRNYVHFGVERDADEIDRNTAEIAVRAAVQLLLGKT